MWGMCHVCVCVCVVWGQTHRLDREKHTHTRTGYILKYSQNISKIISEEWYSLWTPGIIESSIPNKLIACLLLVHPSASNRGPMSMMPRFSENERERAIIGIIECTVNLVRYLFELGFLSFSFISAVSLAWRHHGSLEHTEDRIIFLKGRTLLRALKNNLSSENKRKKKNIKNIYFSFRRE
jgi:hypothetical protein